MTFKHHHNWALVLLRRFTHATLLLVALLHVPPGAVSSSDGSASGCRTALTLSGFVRPVTADKISIQTYDFFSSWFFCHCGIRIHIPMVWFTVQSCRAWESDYCVFFTWVIFTWASISKCHDLLHSSEGGSSQGPAWFASIYIVDASPPILYLSSSCIAVLNNFSAFAPLAWCRRV